MMRTAIVDHAIDSCALLGEVAHSMAEKELDAIAGEAAARWNTSDVIVEHRVGTLRLGEASVAIAIAHAHRGEAYEASRYIIEELKKRLPVWKREHYVDGRAEWVDATSGKPQPGTV